jgi:sugar phosphate isomerase/epimerase
MRLGLSNLAFSEANSLEQLHRLASLGFQGVEVAPTRLGPWETLSCQKLRLFKSELEAFGLQVPSLQAIFFGTENLCLLGSNDAFSRMCQHMNRIGEISEALGAEVAVFGAPRHRSRGELPDDAAFELGIERFSALAAIAENHGFTIGLEPVPSAYGCDFLTTWQLVNAMVRDVAMRGLSVHLDTSCVELGGGNIVEAVQCCRHTLAHFHAAEPDLADFSKPTAGHAEAAHSLNEIGYDRWVVVEMLENKASGPDPVAAAANFVVNTYSKLPEA